MPRGRLLSRLWKGYQLFVPGKAILSLADKNRTPSIDNNPLSFPLEKYVYDQTLL
jgi:hypothetical protein